jgi:hypothetical protein
MYHSGPGGGGGSTSSAAAMQQQSQIRQTGSYPDLSSPQYYPSIDFSSPQQLNRSLHPDTGGSGNSYAIPRQTSGGGVSAQSGNYPYQPQSSSGYPTAYSGNTKLPMQSQSIPSGMQMNSRAPPNSGYSNGAQPYGNSGNGGMPTQHRAYNVAAASSQQRMPSTPSHLGSYSSSGGMYATNSGSYSNPNMGPPPYRSADSDMMPPPHPATLQMQHANSVSSANSGMQPIPHGAPIAKPGKKAAAAAAAAAAASAAAASVAAAGGIVPPLEMEPEIKSVVYKF